MTFGLADVLEQRVGTVDRRNGALEQQVGGPGRIDVEGTFDPVFQDAEIDTGVVRRGRLPAQDRRSQLVGIETVDRVVVVGQVVLAPEHRKRGIRVDGLVTVLAPGEAEFQVVERLAEARVFHEGFAGDVPTQGDGGEDTVFAVGAKGGETVATGRHGEEVAGIVTVVDAQHLGDVRRGRTVCGSGQRIGFVRLPVGHHVIRETRGVDGVGDPV